MFLHKEENHDVKIKKNFAIKKNIKVKMHAKIKSK